MRADAGGVQPSSRIAVDAASSWPAPVIRSGQPPPWRAARSASIAPRANRLVQRAQRQQRGALVERVGAVDAVAIPGLELGEQVERPGAARVADAGRGEAEHHLAGGAGRGDVGGEVPARAGAQGGGARPCAGGRQQPGRAQDDDRVGGLAVAARLELAGDPARGALGGGRVRRGCGRRVRSRDRPRSRRASRGRRQRASCRAPDDVQPRAEALERADERRAEGEAEDEVADRVGDVERQRAAADQQRTARACADPL